MAVSAPFLPPDRQPKGGWVLKLPETGGTVRGADFLLLVKAVNDMLAANGFATLTPETILERVTHA